MLKFLPKRLDERGSAVAEFALIAPLLVTLMLGTVELGRFGLVWASTRDAVVTASRLYRLHPVRTDAEVIAAVQRRVNGYDPGGLKELMVAASWCRSDGRAVRLRQVSATVQHRLLVPFASDQSIRFSHVTTTPVHTDETPPPAGSLSECA